ncbi:AAA family ATPase [Rhodotorula toruloides]|uniref:AAA family ATPase n=1 Tax=Rhodotorula toruloides TaxID=5286 RepID=A0A511KPF3_RHOTO|nr:AAA family ATPase [Rhodotorula toruloides]
MAGPPPVESTDTPDPAPTNGGKRLFAIFAPPSGPSSSTSSRAPALTAAQSKGGKARGEWEALSRTDAKEKEGSVVSLLSDEEDEVVGPKKGRASKGKAKLVVGTKTKGKKDKGKTARPVSMTDEHSSAHDSAEDDDADFEVLSDSTTLSRASSSTRTSRAPKPTRTESQFSATASTSSAVVDLTLSPPRPARPASSSSFAPLSEVYKSQREKLRKDTEGSEPRWPTAEEHAAERSGGAGRSEQGVWGVWEGKIRRAAMDKGKERIRQGENGHPEGGDFLERLEQDLDFGSLASTKASTTPSTSHNCYKTVSYPLSNLPSLLPSPLPSHPLLIRLAAPFLSSDPSTLPFTTNATTESELWTVKHAPQNADEVLGDESGSSAMLLREWLTELKVEGAKTDAKAGKKRRRPVARGLDTCVAAKRKRKKRAKAREDDWIVRSSDEEAEDDEMGGSPSSSFDSRGATDESDDGLDNTRCVSASSAFHSLTNLILLHGPHGSGKSSTVHAVARELGYEVFEVFPGMGRRSAKDVERYVGDAAKNHLVVKGGGLDSPKKGGGGLFAMFSKQQEKGIVTAGEAGAPASKKKERAKEGEQAAGEGKEEKGPTQSLILIDEVDILFKHEEDFWAGASRSLTLLCPSRADLPNLLPAYLAGLVHLAEQSRRPIAMICTDIALIPFDDLNVQQIHLSPHAPPANFLSFAPPAPSLAVPFLHLLSLRAGYIPSTAALEALYDSTAPRHYPAWLLQSQMGTARRGGGGGSGDRPLPSWTSSQPIPARDLRKAIMRLEFECSDRPPSGREGEIVFLQQNQATGGQNDRIVRTAAQVGSAAHLDGLSAALAAADTLSWADSHVVKRIEVRIEDEETGRTPSINDTEFGFTVLDYIPDPNATRLPFAGAEEAMEAALQTLAYRRWADALRFDDLQDDELEENRADYIFHLGGLIHSNGERALIQPPAPILPSSIPVTDYAPFLRLITFADDVNYAAAVQAQDAVAEAGGQDELNSLSVAAALGAAPGPSAAGKIRRSARQKAKQGVPLYERTLPWASERDADWLRKSGFVGETT